MVAAFDPQETFASRAEVATHKLRFGMVNGIDAKTKELKLL